MGFTLARAKEDFELALREKLLDIPPPEEGKEDVFEKDRKQFEKMTLRTMPRISARSSPGAFPKRR
jgi:hypothetical protein